MDRGEAGEGGAADCHMDWLQGPASQYGRQQGAQRRDEARKSAGRVIFANLIHKLTREILQVKVPSAKKVTETIATTADKVLKHIKICLQHCRQITITTDLWSTKCSNQSFIGVTSHAFNPKARKRQSFKL